MAYIPTEWECGDVVTAEKLNNIEEGIQEALESGGGGASFIPYRIELDAEANETYIVDKKLSEIDSNVIGFYNEEQPSTKRFFISVIRPAGELSGGVECFFIGLGTNPGELVPIGITFHPSEDGNSLIATE